MPRDVSTRLRHAIVELASLDTPDLRAILDQLEPSERLRAEALLREFAEIGPGANTPLAQTLMESPDWLSARVLAALPLAERKKETSSLPSLERQRLLALASTVRMTPLAAATLSKLVTQQEKEPPIRGVDGHR